MIRDGQKVSFIGTPDELDIGDEGLVLEAGRRGSHVRWDTGARKGQIDLISNADLVVGTYQDRSVTAATVGLVSFAVRDTYETEGDSGVLRALAKQGAFELEALGAEVRSMIAARLRSDPVISQALCQLNPAEGDGLVESATILALRTALRG